MASRVDPNTTFMAASPSFRGIENRRRARRDEVAKRRQHLELDVRCTCEIDPVCLIHAKQHGRAR
jgi:hypothetical protein